MGESLALGQKAITRMHSLSARLFAGGNDLLDDEIGFCRCGRADMHGLISHFDMERVFISIRIDSDRLDAHALGGLDDTAGNLATVGDENFLEHMRPDRSQRTHAPSENLSGSIFMAAQQFGPFA